MVILERLQVLLAALAVLAPAAHVLELPNKLALDGPLWLAIQQHLYRGWGPFWGAPIEIGALVTSGLLAFMSRHDRVLRLAFAIATAAYAGMIAAFFVFNAPVNAVISAATPPSPPANWHALRTQWESGHAVSAALAVIALAATLERDRFRRKRH